MNANEDDYFNELIKDILISKNMFLEEMKKQMPEYRATNADLSKKLHNNPNIFKPKIITRSINLEPRRPKVNPKKRIMELRQDIDHALETGNKEAFIRASREYNYLKAEFEVEGE